MLFAALAILQTAGSTPAVWRNYEEVFDLAIVGGKVLAATNGGLISGDGMTWTSVSSPSGLRSIEAEGPLAVATASGRRLELDGGAWLPATPRSRVRDLAHGLELGPGDGWLVSQPSLLHQFPTPPPGHAYSVLQSGSDLLAGTAQGLFRFHSGGWTRETLPTRIPVTRPNGFAEVQGAYVVGGMDGLFLGKPGQWKLVATDAIRQVCRLGSDVWVVHGNGALDKIDPSGDQIYPDVMTGASKRPWTSCVGHVGETALFGGMGGWSERTASIVERFPPVLKKDIVTAITGRASTRWIGTEQSGVVRFGPDGIHRWNPGNGLTDTWVTSFCRTPGGLVVGTMHSGLFMIVGDGIEAIASPTKRVTQLGLWKGTLVVGGMDGAWVRRGTKWSPLDTHGEETTSLNELSGRLAITTASGLYLF